MDDFLNGSAMTDEMQRRESLLVAVNPLGPAIEHASKNARVPSTPINRHGMAQNGTPSVSTGEHGLKRVKSFVRRMKHSTSRRDLTKGNGDPADDSEPVGESAVPSRPAAAWEDSTVEDLQRMRRIATMQQRFLAGSTTGASLQAEEARMRGLDGGEGHSEQTAPGSRSKAAKKRSSDVAHSHRDGTPVHQVHRVSLGEDDASASTATVSSSSNSSGSSAKKSAKKLLRSLSKRRVHSSSLSAHNDDMVLDVHGHQGDIRGHGGRPLSARGKLQDSSSSSLAPDGTLSGSNTSNNNNSSSSSSSSSSSNNNNNNTSNNNIDNAQLRTPLRTRPRSQTIFGLPSVQDSPASSTVLLTVGDKVGNTQPGHTRDVSLRLAQQVDVLQQPDSTPEQLMAALSALSRLRGDAAPTVPVIASLWAEPGQRPAIRDECVRVLEDGIGPFATVRFLARMIGQDSPQSTAECRRTASDLLSTLAMRAAGRKAGRHLLEIVVGFASAVAAGIKDEDDYVRTCCLATLACLPADLVARTKAKLAHTAARQQREQQQKDQLAAQQSGGAVVRSNPLRAHAQASANDTSLLSPAGMRHRPQQPAMSPATAAHHESVAALAMALRNGSDGQREQALIKVVSMGELAVGAADALVHVLATERTPAVRALAARALGIVGGDMMAVGALRGAARNDKDAAVRRSAVKAVERLQRRGAVREGLEELFAVEEGSTGMDSMDNSGSSAGVHVAGSGDGMDIVDGDGGDKESSSSSSSSTSSKLSRFLPRTPKRHRRQRPHSSSENAVTNI